MENGLSQAEANRRLEPVIYDYVSWIEKSREHLSVNIWSHVSGKYQWIVKILYILGTVFVLCAVFLCAHSGFPLTDAILPIFALLTQLIYQFYVIIRKKRIRNLKAEIRRAFEEYKSNCDITNLLELNAPFSPCINTQWTFRENKIINLPAAFLVPGDRILLRPGQVVFCKCHVAELDVDIQPGEEYLDDRITDLCSRKLTFHPPRECVSAVVLESPLTSFASNLSSSKHGKTLPSPVFCFYLVQGLHHFLVVNFVTSVLLLLWIIFVLCRSGWTSVPHLAWAFRLLGLSLLTNGFVATPVVLDALLAYGCSRLRQVHENHAAFRQSAHLGNLMSTIHAVNNQAADQTSIASSFSSTMSSGSSTPPRKDSLSVRPGIICAPINISSKCRKMMKALLEFWNDFIVRPDDHLNYLLLSLGSITSLCCVDKKGILSHSTPTPEKVFFFRHKHRKARRHRHREATKVSNHGMDSDTNDLPHPHAKEQVSDTESIITSHSLRRPDQVRIRSAEKAKRASRSSLQPIVLDLGSNISRPGAVYFDEPKWERYLSSLKPIGLGILLNNCQPSIINAYTKYSDFMTTVSRCAPTPNKPVAVVNHSWISNARCLCGLARTVGFKPNAVGHFNVQNCIACFRLSPDAPPLRDRNINGNAMLASLNRVDDLTVVDSYGEHTEEMDAQNCFKAQSPLSTLFSVVTSDMCGGGYQLMSQGTGDLLASLCCDAWDGRNIVALEAEDRAAILDFYNRNVFSSYCTGFAYAPLLDRVTFGNPVEPSEQCGIPVIKDALLLEIPPLFSSLSQYLRATGRGDSGSVNVKTAGVTGTSCQLDSQLSHHLDSSTSTDEQNASVTESTMRGDPERNYSALGLSETPHRRPNLHLNLPSSADQSKRRSRHSECNEDVSPADEFDGDNGPRTMRQAFSAESLANLQIEGGTADPESVHNMLKSQVFLGLISLQYEVNPGVIETVNVLEQACIRFVHFSKENQLRSRVFAQRLGIESGWNCHISLADQSPMTDEVRCARSSSPRQELLPVDPFGASLQPSNSCPSLNVTIENIPAAPITESGSIPRIIQPVNVTFTSSTSSTLTSGEEASQGSLSTSSLAGNAPEPYECEINFNSNKSRLPTGVRNIRPHLENVDNVPLLVSLFTDSTVDSVAEMISIMQEYGEVVCIVGSCLSLNNVRLFARADAALALFPQLPSICTGDWEHKFATTATTNSSNADNAKEINVNADGTPGLYHSGEDEVRLKQNTAAAKDAGPRSFASLEFAGKLISLFNPLLGDMHRDGFAVYSLIWESHFTVGNLHLCWQFGLLASLVTNVLILLLSLLCPWLSVRNTADQPAVPPQLAPSFMRFSLRDEMLTGTAETGTFVWIIWVVVPLLTLSIAHRSVERGKPMRQPPLKRHQLFSRKRFFRFMMVNLARFLPSVLTCVLSFGLHFLLHLECSSWFDHMFCKSQSNVAEPFSPAYALVLYQFVLSLVSFTFANYGQRFTKFRPCTNWAWLLVAFFIVAGHSTWCFATGVFRHFHAFHILSVYINLMVLFLFNELINWWERVVVRAEHRLARLYFGTKLGMYSPV